jgi:hypothetical protein
MVEAPRQTAQDYLAFAAEQADSIAIKPRQG